MATPHPVRAHIAMRPGTTMRELARQAPCSYGHLRQAALGERIPSYDLAKRVADLLGLPVEMCWDMRRVGAPREVRQ